MVSSSGYTVSVSVFQGAPPPLGEGAASSGEDVYYAGRQTMSTTFWKFVRRIFGAWNVPAAGTAPHAEKPSRYPELPWASSAHDPHAEAASIQWHPHRCRALPRAGMRAVGRTLRAAEPHMQQRWRGATLGRPTAHAPARSTDSPARGPTKETASARELAAGAFVRSGAKGRCAACAKTPAQISLYKGCACETMTETAPAGVDAAPAHTEGGP